MPSHHICEELKEWHINYKDVPNSWLIVLKHALRVCVGVRILEVFWLCVTLSMLLHSLSAQVKVLIKCYLTVIPTVHFHF